jgi:hypothetical protein
LVIIYQHLSATSNPPTQRQKTSNPLTQNLTSNPQPKLYENHKKRL